MNERNKYSFKLNLESFNLVKLALDCVVINKECIWWKPSRVIKGNRNFFQKRYKGSTIRKRQKAHNSLKRCEKTRKLYAMAIDKIKGETCYLFWRVEAAIPEPPLEASPVRDGLGKVDEVDPSCLLTNAMVAFVFASFHVEQR